MDFANLLEGVASGNPLQMAGGVIGGLSGLFGGPKPVPGNEKPVQERIGDKNRLTGEQVGWICALEESRVSDDFNDIVDRAEKDNNYFLGLLKRYQNAKPWENVVPGNAAWQATQYTPGVQLGEGLPGTGAYAAQTYQPGVQLGTSIFSAAGTSTASLGAQLTSQDIKNIGTGILNGAIAGGQSAAMDTEEGKAATRSAMNSYIKEYQLPIAAGVGGIIWLAVKAFSKK